VLSLGAVRSLHWTETFGKFFMHPEGNLLCFPQHFADCGSIVETDSPFNLNKSFYQRTCIHFDPNPSMVIVSSNFDF
jgi:hypothetical protein